jgi:hypothetical protein
MTAVFADKLNNFRWRERLDGAVPVFAFLLFNRRFYG